MAAESPDREADRLIRDYLVAAGRKNLTTRPRVLKSFAAFLYQMNRRIARLRYRDLETFVAFMRARGVRQFNVSHDFTTLRKFYDYLRAVGAVPTNLARSIMVSAGRKHVRMYTDAELIRVFRTKHPRR